MVIDYVNEEFKLKIMGIDGIYKGLSLIMQSTDHRKH